MWSDPSTPPPAASAPRGATQAAHPDQTLSGEDVPATAAVPVPSLPDAERRQLTVLFCDLVDSTTLAHQLDPEDLREVVRAYQETCAEVIQRFAGYIAQYLGDGVLVYFGYPQAHEDDAQRAVRAGLAILEAMAHLKTRLERERQVRLAVRLGIDTGLVVVGAMGGRGRHEQLALGETPNVAARLQGLAAPDTVVISATTYALVQGFFACHALGLQTLKGVTTPVQAYRILGASGAQNRLDVAHPRGLTPLVGREAELALLVRDPEHGETLRVRRITVKLTEPTRNGDTELHILANVPIRRAAAAYLARLYGKRWSIETAFFEITTTLACEINTLAYPKAALFTLCLALLAYNAVSLIKAALRSAHGRQKVNDEVSSYYLALEIGRTYDGMMIAIPPLHWVLFRELSGQAFADALCELASSVNLARYQKHPRGPKKTPPERTAYQNGKHVSTAKLLAQR